MLKSYGLLTRGLEDMNMLELGKLVLSANPTAMIPLRPSHNSIDLDSRQDHSKSWRPQDDEVALYDRSENAMKMMWAVPITLYIVQTILACC